jgi:YbbR domain-containing protein
MALSRILLRNPGTKLLALAIAVVVWFSLSGERRERTSERSYHMPLSIVNIPARSLVASTLPASVDVRLRGPFTALRQLEPDKLEAVLDLKAAEPGEVVYRFTAEDVNVPPEVEVISISPPEVRFLLDALQERLLPVDATVTGQPAPGMRVAEARAEPPQARVAGPAGALSRMSSVPTAAVSVEGRAASFSSTAPLLLSGTGVRLRQNPLVLVVVRMEPAPTPPATPTAARRPGPR